MDNHPLVSVIVPVYNVEKYLGKCLDSILSQTYGNLELILVDDGSPDLSGAICDEYAKKDERIKVIHKENEGLNFARKSGFEISTGQYVIFVDSDDLIRLETINTLVKTANTENVDFVVGGYEKFSSDLPDLSIEHSKAANVKVLNKDDAIHGLLLGIGDSNILMMTAWGKLFRREIIKQVDWSQSNYRSNEDEFMALQYYSYMQNKIAVVIEGLYLYRENPNSITRAEYKNSFEGKRLNKFDTLEKIYQEASKRLDKKYTSLVLAKFIYDFVISIHKEVLNDTSYELAATANNKYFLSKKKLFNSEVLSRVDPQTQAQYDGLMNQGVVGCIQAKAEFIEQENSENLNYIHNLEKAIEDKDRAIQVIEADVKRKSEEITRLNSTLAVRLDKKARIVAGRIADKIKKTK